MSAETQELERECMKALQCLYIAVEADVAADVNTKVRAYIDTLAAEHARVCGERDEYRSFNDKLTQLQQTQPNVQTIVDALTLMNSWHQDATALWSEWDQSVYDRLLKLRDTLAQHADAQSAMYAHKYLRANDYAGIVEDERDDVKSKLATAEAERARLAGIVERANDLVARTRMYMPVPGETKAETRANLNQWRDLLADIETFEELTTPPRADAQERAE